MGRRHSGHPLSNAATASNVRVTNSRIYKAPFTPVMTVAEFGEGRCFQQQSPNSATIGENGDSGRKRRLSPNLMTLPNSATNCRRFRRLHPVWTGLKDAFGGKR